MKERIVVFDIEVLNQDPTSVCAIGIVELIDKKIASTYYSLIQPRNLSFDAFRYKVHQIKPQSLKKEKTFPTVWKEIKHYFQESIVVSHDIQGDMMYLRETMKSYGISYPHLYMSCTNVLAHLVYPHMQKYNLTELAQMIDLDFHAHHALDDAKACSAILIEMMNKKQCATLKQLHELYHLEFGEMKENYYHNIISPEIVNQLLDMDNHEENYLYHQAICFTGKLSVPKDIMEEKVRQACALSVSQVSMHTNYLVIGKNGYHKVRFGKKNKKVRKALQLMKQGQDIQIIHENELIRLLDTKR